MTPPGPTPARRGLLYAAVFLSGCAGLVHEIVWSKMLVTLTGSTAHAQVVVLAVFMGGLALGAVIFGRRSDRREQPLRTYARLELLIAVYSVVLPLVLLAAEAGYAALASRFLEHRGTLFGLRLALSAVCTLLPAIWMGGTLPVMARFLAERIEQTRGAVARLYALNNIGAVIGVGVAGFWTLGVFGTFVSLGLACALNLAAAGLALRAARSAKDLPEAAPAALPAPAPEGGERYTRLQYGATLAALFASGFAAMGYEVVFTRVIALSFGSSTYSFTVMLMSFITGLGIGSAIVARLKVERPLWLFATSQLLAAVALVAMTPLISRLPYLIGLLRIRLGTDVSGFLWYETGKAGLILLFLLLPTACIGFGFPLVSQIQARSPGRIGGAVGSTYAWNTVGNVLGVTLTGLVLLPALGVSGAFHVNLAFSVAAGAIVLAASVDVPLARRAAAGAIAAAAFLLYAMAGTAWMVPVNRAVDHLRLREAPDAGLPAALRARHPASSFAAWRKEYVKLPADHPRYFLREDANATVIAYGGDEGVVLAVNSKPDATSYTDPRSSDVTTQMLLAHLPMIFARDPRSVLVIGHGSGITVGSAVLHGVERADVVEISRGVLEADALFAADNHGVLSDPRVRVWEEDGRTFLRTAPWTWDVIISEPSNPWIAGIGGLFTRECYQEARAKLGPGGVLCAWFHVYEQSDESIQLVLRTIADVFEHALVFQVLLDGDVIVLASNDPLEPDFARMEALFERPEMRADLARLHAYHLATLLMFHAVPSAAFRRVGGEGPVNTDRHQRLEYMAPKAHFANRISDVVWRNYDLARAIRNPGDNMLDRYARWRAEQGDPLSREELQAVLRRIQTSVAPGDAMALVEAITVRGDKAPPRTAPAKLVARGAVPDFATLGHLEATGRGADLFNGGDPDTAIRMWRHALERKPTHEAAIANLVLGLQRAGNRAEALAVLEKGMASLPRSGYLRMRAAQILEEANDLGRAMTLLEQARELEPEHLEILSTMGRVAFKRNEHAKAMECFQRSFDLDPSQWRAAGMLAQLLAAQPDGRLRALYVLETALRFSPGQPELLQLMQGLRGGR